MSFAVGTGWSNLGLVVSGSQVAARATPPPPSASASAVAMHAPIRSRIALPLAVPMIAGRGYPSLCGGVKGCPRSGPHPPHRLQSRAGPLAQLVEQGTFNPKVAGSRPARPIGIQVRLSHIVDGTVPQRGSGEKDDGRKHGE